MAEQADQFAEAQVYMSRAYALERRANEYAAAPAPVMATPSPVSQALLRGHAHMISVVLNESMATCTELRQIQAAREAQRIADEERRRLEEEEAAATGVPTSQLRALTLNETNAAASAGEQQNQQQLRQTPREEQDTLARQQHERHVMQSQDRTHTHAHAQAAEYAQMHAQAQAQAALERAKETQQAYAHAQQAYYHALPRSSETEDERNARFARDLQVQWQQEQLQQQHQRRHPHP